jgi:hypothetical protein
MVKDTFHINFSMDTTPRYSTSRTEGQSQLAGHKNTKVKDTYQIDFSMDATPRSSKSQTGG